MRVVCVASVVVLRVVHMCVIVLCAAACDVVCVCACVRWHWVRVFSLCERDCVRCVLRAVECVCIVWNVVVAVVCGVVVGS